MKISELIKILQLQLELRGDIETYYEGQDYPEKIVGTYYIERECSFCEKNSLMLIAAEDSWEKGFK